MYLYDDTSPQSAMALVQAAKNLPCLEELEVVLPSLHRPDLMQPVLTLFSWLKSSQCRVVNLALKPGYEDQVPLIFETIPEIPSLKSIGLNLDAVDFDLKPFFRAISASPSINHISFDAWFFNKKSTKELVEFQLDCRPRLLTITLKNGAVLLDSVSRSQLTFISLVHHALNNFHQFSKNNLFPISVWPVVLETLGEGLQDPTVGQSSAVVAGIEAMFDMLRMFLPNFVSSLPSAAYDVE